MGDRPSGRAEAQEKKRSVVRLAGANGGRMPEVVVENFERACIHTLPVVCEQAVVA